MVMKVAFDVGNTAVKVGLFIGDKLTRHFSIPKLTYPVYRSIVREENPDFTIISSVRRLSEGMRQLADNEDQIFILTPKLRLPVKIDYKSPQTLGPDRIAGVCGAWHLFPNRNSLVIDAGTCITYDILTHLGYFVGGNISPGLKLRTKAMHRFTDQLPQVDLVERYLEIGNDTTTALQTGAQGGAVHEMKGFIRQYQKSYDRLNILLTGGDRHFFVNYLKIKIFVRPHLVLLGLNKILDVNI